MGQKVHPKGLRLGIVDDWESKWYAEKDFSRFLLEDFKIRKWLEEKFQKAGISKILIERATNKLKVTVFAARPGIIIGRKGETIEKIKEELEKMVEGEKVFLNVQEIPIPELDAQLVAERICFQLQRRVSARRIMRETIARVMELGAEGIKICIKGRIGGAEIARKEWMMEGKVPLHTLSSEIDYGVSTARTVYGCVGVKVWINKGEKKKEEETSASSAEES